MRTDIDRRGNDAAAAARDAVMPVVAAASPRFPGDAGRPWRSTSFLLAAACLAAALIVMVARWSYNSTVSTGPASNTPAPTTALGPPPTLPPASIPGGTPISSGRTSDGRTWSLSIGGPSNDVCLFVDLGSRTGTGSCAGAPFGAPAPDPYQPLVENDSRIIPMVFGRVAPDVVSVEVVLATGQPVGSVPVIEGNGGPFYAVEVPRPNRPVAVVGHRSDGTTVRYNVPS
jgi:hypothetical protein